MDARVSETDAALLSPNTDGGAPALLPASEVADLGGGRMPAPAESGFLQNLVHRTRESVWAPVAIKATSIGVGMLGLAAIGAWSTLAGAGTPVTAASVTAQQRTTATLAASPVTEPAHPAGTSGAAAAPASPPASSGSGTTADGKVILNAATADDLTKLPRVGPKRAAAILDLRKRLGKFRQPTDLLRVRGIGRKTLRQLLPLLVVDSPASPNK